MRCAERGRHGIGHQEVERPLGVGVAQHDGRPDELAALQAHALPRHDLGHRGAGGQHGAGLHRGVGDGEAHHPHAPLDVAPHRPLALQVALVVHELHRCGAPVLGAGIGADHALAEQRVLQPLVGEVVVEHIADRGLEQDLGQPRVATHQLLELVAGGRRAEPAVACARAQELAHVVEDLFVGPVALDVGVRDTQGLQAGLGARVVGPLPERGAVGERSPEVRVGHEHLEAPVGEPQLVDHELVEQAHHVGAGRHHVPLVGEGPLEGAGAAEPLPPLEHEHRLAGPGQVGRGGQAVVATTDHHDVPGPGGQLRHGSGQAHLAQLGRDAVHDGTSSCG